MKAGPHSSRHKSPQYNREGPGLRRKGSDSDFDSRAAWPHDRGNIIRLDIRGMIYATIIAVTLGTLAALWTTGPFWRGLIIGCAIGVWVAVGLRL